MLQAAFFLLFRAPQVFYEGDKVINLEAEVLRASKLKCGKCGKKGAALGCFLEKCKKSYHVPCAVQLRGCRWDCVCSHLHMLSPLFS